MSIITEWKVLNKTTVDTKKVLGAISHIYWRLRIINNVTKQYADHNDVTCFEVEDTVIENVVTKENTVVSGCIDVSTFKNYSSVSDSDLVEWIKNDLVKTDRYYPLLERLTKIVN